MFAHEADVEKLKEEIRRIDALLSLLDEKVSCPLKKNCPVMNPPDPPA